MGGGVRGAQSQNDHYFFTVGFLWNLEQFFSRLLQSYSIGLKLKFQKGAPYFLMGGGGQSQNDHYRATAVRSPPQFRRKRPKKRLGRHRWRGSISDKSRLPEWHFSKSIWSAFPIEQSLSLINCRFSWPIRIRWRKPYFEIWKNLCYCVTLKYVKIASEIESSASCASS